MKRFLVADDNVDAADALAMLLRMRGHEVQTVSDGEAALRALQAFRPDVALLDIGMPKLNGYQIASQARAAAWADSITLVALTGWGQEGDRSSAQYAGFHHHFVKPVGLDSLLATVLPSNSP